MRIVHYITIDQGSGPVTLLDVEGAAGQAMLRIVHRARFDKVREVDAAAARAAIDQAANLGEATTKVLAEHVGVITQAALAWAVANGANAKAIRWGRDGTAILFKTEAEATAWDQVDENVQPAQQPRKRRMILG